VPRSEFNFFFWFTAHNAVVKWYSTPVLTIWFVSVYERVRMVPYERILLESLQILDKCPHNFLFSMLKRYYYPVNPLCAMAAQGMKTVYADPWNTSMWRAFVVPNRPNYDV